MTELNLLNSALLLPRTFGNTDLLGEEDKLCDTNHHLNLFCSTCAYMKVYFLLPNT